MQERVGDVPVRTRLLCLCELQDLQQHRSRGYRQVVNVPNVLLVPKWWPMCTPILPRTGQLDYDADIPAFNIELKMIEAENVP